jgi:hypothetical protein
LVQSPAELKLWYAELWFRQYFSVYAAVAA